MDGKYGGKIGFGINQNNRPQASVNIFNGARAQCAYHEITVGQDSGARLVESSVSVSTLNLKPAQSFNFHIAVNRNGGGSLEVNDRKKALPEEFTRDRMVGRLGLSAGDKAICLFNGVEVRRGQPFWPVSAN